MSPYFSNLKVPDKKSIIYLLIAAVFVAAIFVAVMLVIYKKGPEAPADQQAQEDILINKQLQGLDKMRKEADIQPPTEEQAQGQLNELEAQRREENSKPTPLSDEQIEKQLIEKQLDELAKMRGEAR